MSGNCQTPSIEMCAAGPDVDVYNCQPTSHGENQTTHIGVQDYESQFLLEDRSMAFVLIRSN